MSPDSVPGILTPPTPEEIQARAQAAVAGDLARHCRLIADHLAYAMQMAQARQDLDPMAEMDARLDVLLTYEQALAKRAGSPTADRRYEPQLRTSRIGDTTQ
jgi:hypothetical protein